MEHYGLIRVKGEPIEYRHSWDQRKRLYKRVHRDRPSSRPQPRVRGTSPVAVSLASGTRSIAADPPGSLMRPTFSIIPHLFAVSLLGLMIIAPVNAQTSSEANGGELGAFTLGERTPLNRGISKTDPAAANDTQETNETIDYESEAGTPADPGPTEPYAVIPEPDAKAESEAGTVAETNPSNDQPEPDLTSADLELIPNGSQILINIDKSRQEMTVFLDGTEQHTWPVSTGAPGYATPSGNFTASSMNEVWYSKEWDNAPMPNSIFFTKEGHAIHGSHETKKLGRAVSHGCVRLAPENAKTLYALVEEQGLENTKIVLTGVTPGGEAKVANQARSKKRNRQAAMARYDRPDYYYPSRPQRRGLFARRSFNGPYDDGPKGYYRPPRGSYPSRGYRPYAD